MSKEDHRCGEHQLPELPVGILFHGGFFCLECDPSAGLGAAVYRINIFPYRASCLQCGTVCVEPQSPAWPDLFVDAARDVHKKCLGYAVETFFARGNPFEVCGCVVPGELARALGDHVREAHEEACGVPQGGRS